MGLHIGDLLIPNIRIYTTTGTGNGNYQNKTVTPSTSAQIITADSNYDALAQVTVAAISPIKSSSDITVSGATVTVPIGFYSSQTTKTIASGSVSNPTATKGTVNNHTITVTPKVTSTTGYITGVTDQTGTAITISASELVNGTKTITANGVGIDVTNYASVDVAVSGNAPIINSLTVTPSESEQTFNSSSVDGYKPVVVSAISSTYIGSEIAQRSSTDLTASGATITAPAGYYSTAATKTIANGSYGSFSTSFSKNSSIFYVNITYNNFQAGYFSTSPTFTPTLSVENKNVTPSSAAQTITPTSNSYYLNSVTVAGDENLIAGNIKNGVSIFGVTGTYADASTNNQNKTVTPSESQQIISADSDYTGLGTVTVEAIPIISSYTISNANANFYTENGTRKWRIQPNITSSEDGYLHFQRYLSITGNYSTYRALASNTIITPTETQQTVGGSDWMMEGAITISAIPSNYIGSGITQRDSTDLTASGATVTVPAGYYATNATKSITTSTITNTVINGSATLEDTNDYAFDVTVTIPAGYYAATTLTKSFSSILPAPETEGTASQVLVGYDLYNHDGQLITGSMANNGSWNRTLDDSTTSVTIPTGYHNGSGTVSHTTVNIPDPTITIDSSTGVITANGNWTKGFTTDNSYSKTYNLTTQAATTATPTESEQTIVTAGKYTLGAIKVAAISSTYVGSGITQRSSTDLTLSGRVVTAPAGYYANNASYEISSESYSNLLIRYDDDPQYYSIRVDKSGWYNVGTRYVAYTTLPSSTITVDNSGLITSSLTINNGVYKAQTKNTTSQLAVQAATIYTPTTTNQTIAAGKYLTGIQTILGDENLIADNIKSGVTIFGVLGTHAGGSTINNQNKTITPSTSQQTVTYDSGYTGLGTVTVEAVPTAVFDDATLNYSGRSGSFRIQWPLTTAGYVSTGLQTFINPEDITGDFDVISSDMLITPTESQQAVASYGTFVNANITVDAIPNNYVGSAITSRSSSDLTVSGATVTAPAGYYATAASKSVASGSATGPTSLSGTGASITTGTNTITFTKTGVTTTPTVVAGYVASATASTATVSLTANITPRTSSSVTASGATVTIPAGYYASQVTKTISSGTATNSGSKNETSATLSTGTNTLTLTKSVSIIPTVTAGYISAGTAGNVSISLTASVTTKAAATITPGTSNQTIASGTYLTGTQIISGDADLVAGNIKSGVNIFGVTGTYSGLDTSDATATAADIVNGETAYVDGRMITGNLVIQTYYTGTTAPASSLGKDGDIYLRS